MPRTTSARRYAEAAFEIAQRDEALDEWLEHLERVAEVGSVEGADRTLENPAIPFEKRADLLARALGDGAPQQLRNLVLLLLRRGRVALVPRVAAEFRRLYNRRAGIVTAIVTSASDLDDGEVRELTQRLERMTGGKADLEFRVDPSLLGGIVVRVGDRLIDGSVRSRLERLRSRVAAGAI
jgi:F-type H+-transporting ATPase subunit delta